MLRIRKIYLIIITILLANGEYALTQEISYSMNEDLEDVITIKKPVESSYFNCIDVGDIDQDGYEDIIIRGSLGSYKGVIYIIYGEKQWDNTIELDSENQRVTSIVFEDHSIYSSQHGDINGDHISIYRQKAKRRCCRN